MGTIIQTFPNVSKTGISVNATLLANGWDSNNRQTLTFTGYDASVDGIIGMPSTVTASQKESYSAAIIRVYSVSGSAITFECDNVPEIDLPVSLITGATGGGSTGGAVDSVNGKTGTVTLTYTDVGAAASSHNHTVSNISDFPSLGTAAAANTASSVTSGSDDLPTGGAVYTAIQDALEAYGIAENTSF